MIGPIHNFKELSIWQRSMDLTYLIYKVTAKLPSEERFNLTSQINRSAVSIPSNIAEGSGRNTDKDFIKFLDYSIASSYELETQLLLAGNLYQLEVREPIQQIGEVQRMIMGFKKKLSNNVKR